MLMNIREQGNSGIDTQSERLNRINQINQAFVKYFFEHFVKHKWPYSLRHTCEKEPGSATEPIGLQKSRTKMVWHRSGCLPLFWPQRLGCSPRPQGVNGSAISVRHLSHLHQSSRGPPQETEQRSESCS